MQSSKSRYQIVIQALQLAGRNVELRTVAEDLLNSLLRGWAQSYKYPFLKKTGAAITLAAGASTASIPTDMGAGMDNLLFGPEKSPLFEKSMDEFVGLGGFKATTAGNGRPGFYVLDQEGGNFVFDQTADIAYTFYPIYYKIPADIPSESPADDATKVWMPDDLLVVQGLVGCLYQYLVDPREMAQRALVEGMLAKFQRGSAPVGGGQPKVGLSRSVFRNRKL